MNYSDRPIHSKDEDQLGRSHFASMCARAIVNLRIEETFTIGLYGKWGNGKTSLINLMVNEIEGLNASKQDVEQMHIVRFEPWAFSDSNQLMSQFFIHLANELRGKGSAVISNIGEKLEKYAWLWQVSKMVPWEVMVPLLGQGAREMADAAQNVTENIGRTMHGDAMSADILTQKKAIVNLLEKQEDRILIVIDDIDRLNNDQIRQVFQLVTAVANFPNVTYLLSFDKEIVVNALAEVQKGNGEEYLEKVVQMPISLPDVQREDIKKILYTRLRDIQRQYTADLFDENNWNLNYPYFFDPFIKNIRDINRLCNVVAFKYGAMAYDVFFMDLVGITVLELFSPKAYEWVKMNSEMVLGDYGDQYSLMSEYDKRDLEDELQEYLSEGMTNAEKTTVIKVIKVLFPFYKVGEGKYTVRLEGRSNRALSTWRIYEGRCFQRYFHLDINRLPVNDTKLNELIFRSNRGQLSEFFSEYEGTDVMDLFFNVVSEKINDIDSARILMLMKELIFASRFFKKMPRWKVTSFLKYEFWLKENVVLAFLSKTDREDAVIYAYVLEIFGPRRAGLFWNEQYYKKVQSAFLERMKELEWEKWILDQSDLNGFFICRELNKIDSTHVANRFRVLCEDDSNTVKIVDWIVRQNHNVISDEIRWKVDTYYPFITADQICDAITRQKEINAIPPHLAEKCEFFLEHSSDYKEPPASDEED